MHPRCFQEPFRSVQKATKVAQDPPKSRPRPPQRSPKAAQGPPRRLPNHSKIKSWDPQQAFSAASSSGKPSGAVRERFVDDFAMLRRSSKGDFSAHTRCFYRVFAMLSMQARSRADAWKNDVVEPPKASPEISRGSQRSNFKRQNAHVGRNNSDAAPPGPPQILKATSNEPLRARKHAAGAAQGGLMHEASKSQFQNVQMDIQYLT